MSIANYHRLQLESYRDISTLTILVYSDGSYNGIDSIVDKLIQQVRGKYERIVIYSNIDLVINDVTLEKRVAPLRDLITSVCFKENFRFIGFMKTNTFSYDETVAYLKCTNVQYRIYDITNKKWVIGKGDMDYG